MPPFPAPRAAQQPFTINKKETPHASSVTGGGLRGNYTAAGTAEINSDQKKVYLIFFLVDVFHK